MTGVSGKDFDRLARLVRGQNERLGKLAEAVAWLVETTALAAVAQSLPPSDDRHRRAVSRLSHIADVSGLVGVSPSDWAKTQDEEAGDEPS